jgi:alkylhydroperoxidase family enzyme
VLGQATVDAVLADPATAPIPESLRATLALLRTVTLAHESLTASDVEPLLALGVTRSQIEDALNVAFAFNVITRLADTFQFEIRTPDAVDAAATRLLTRGYKLTGR